MKGLPVENLVPEFKPRPPKPAWVKTEIKDKGVKKVQDKLIKDQGKLRWITFPDEETGEDMLIAFELLDKYKRDKSFLQKDLIKTKKKGELVLDIVETKPKTKIDPTLTQDERHRIIKEKREKRREDQALREKAEAEKRKNDMSERRKKEADAAKRRASAVREKKS